MSSPVKGFASKFRRPAAENEFATVEPVLGGQFGLSVQAHMFYELIVADAAEAGSTATEIVATAHVARVGDLIRFTSGATSGYQAKVSAVAANQISLVEALPAAPAAADTFDILRNRAPLVGAGGNMAVSVSDGTDTLQIYQEDAVSAGNELGIFPLGVRQDAAGSPVSADGDYHGLLFNNNGEVKVAATFTESAVFAEDAAAAGGATGKFILGVRNDASAVVTSADGDYSQVSVDSAGRTKVVSESVIPGVGATNLGKAEDAVHASGDTGVMTLGVRSDAGGPFAADGDYVPFSMNANNELRVAASITEAATFAEDSAAADGATGKFVLAVRNDASAALTTADGDYSAFAVDSAGRQKVVVEGALPGQFAEDSAHASGNTGSFMLAVRNDAAAALTSADGDYSPLAVDSAGRPKVVIDSIIPGVAATSLGKAEDAAHSSGDTGVMQLAVRNDSAVALAGADLDYIPLSTDALGYLRTVEKPLDVVDLLDVPFFDATTIAGSAGAFAEVVASTAAATRKIQIFDTSGAFIGVYTGAAAAEALKFVFGPGTNETIEVSIPAGTRISLRSLEAAAPTAGNITMNFMG